MGSDVMYWCDPSWHEGSKTPARYFILAQPHERAIHLQPNAFSCCEDHLVDALKIMLDKHANVTVRRVNKDT